MWFRHNIRKEPSRIYNSRNFICGLDGKYLITSVLSTTVEILYVVQTSKPSHSFSNLQQQKFYMWFRQATRATYTVGSTTVEILYVVQTISSVSSMFYLQQQKFYMWFRRGWCGVSIPNLQQQKFYMWFRREGFEYELTNLQQQKFYMWFRHPLVKKILGTSTTVEILYVVQTWLDISRI